MTKDIAENKVLESLDNAISDFAKNNYLPNASNKGNKDTDNISMVSNNNEPTDFSELMIAKNKGKVKRKTKEAGVVSKKGSKINGFYTKREKEVPKKLLKKNKLVRSKYFRMPSFRMNAKNSLLAKTFGIYHNQKKNLVTMCLAVMMVAFVTASTYVAYAYVTSINNDLVNNVAKHLVIPSNETPKVYIVQSEKSDIFQNPTFKGIQVGDNVLTYTKSGKVVIYRSSEDKIVNIVNLTQ